MLRENDGRGATGAGEAAGDCAPTAKPRREGFRKLRNTVTVTIQILIIEMSLAIPGFLASASAAERTDLSPRDRAVISSLVDQTRRENQAKGFPTGAFRADELSRMWERQFVDARQRLEDLRPKLNEYLERKRGDRDGYVIAQSMSNALGILRAEDEPEAKMLLPLLSDLRARHPEFERMQDFRLSDEDKGPERATADLNASWWPKDDVVFGRFIVGNKVAVKYQFRMEFFALPGGVTSRLTPPGSLDFAMANGSTVAVRPRSTMRFRQNVIAYPRVWENNESERLLICTSQEATYSPTTASDRRNAQRPANRAKLPADVKLGQFQDYCGVVGLDGAEVFRFPQRLRRPGTHWEPLEIVGRGTRAAVLVRGNATSKYQAILLWDFPDKVRVVELKNPDETTMSLYPKFVNEKL